jgi:hemerythrin superfamily protein
MDIYNVIQKDHEEAKGIMQKIMSARSETTRKRLLDELMVAIEVHAKTEEQTFYEALRQHEETREKAEHGKEEHETVEQLFAQIAKVKPENDKWLILFGEIKMALEHHMKEEEEEMFEKARKVLASSEAKELGKQMENLKEETRQEVMKMVAA